MKILLCNDTGTKSHIGCQAVSDSHARMLGRMGHTVLYRYFVNKLADHARPTLAETVVALERDGKLMERLSQCDAVIVNGEGTLHHNRGLEYIALLMLAKRQGKATLLVNALIQEMEADLDVLNSLDAFYVRDTLSEAYVKARGIRCSHAPDSILAAKFSTGSKLDFHGDLVVTDWHKSRDSDVGVTSSRLLVDAHAQERRQFFPLHAPGASKHWSEAVAAIRTSCMVVSARHHGIYLAMMAGVPVIPLESNSWKIRALVEMHALPTITNGDYSSVIAQIRDNGANTTALSEAKKRLMDKLPLPIFDVLGRGDEDTSEDLEVARLHEQIATRTGAKRRDKVIMAKRRCKEMTMRWQAHIGWNGLIPGHVA